MLIAVERLLVRVRQVPARAEELITLRARLRTQRAAGAPADERALAERLRTLKADASAMLGGVEACRTCAVGRLRPRGTFPGGDCCSGVTADLFDDDELAALAAGGTRPGDLRAPRTDTAGCAFRGAEGCTLAVVDRPVRCVHYTCMTLRRELAARGNRDAIDAALAELRATLATLTSRRHARLDDALLAPLEAAVTAVARERARRTPPGPARLAPRSR